MPGLDPYIGCCRVRPTPTGCVRSFTTWITAPQPDLDVLVPAVLDGAINYLRRGKRTFAGRGQDRRWNSAERYPGDAGVLAAMLLNRVTWPRARRMYLPAGNLHAYLHGVGVEVMANSDNVLRGGLTPKHVDVPELLRVLDFSPTTESAMAPTVTGTALELIYRHTRPGVRGVGAGRGRRAPRARGRRPARHDGPQILLCTEGSVAVHAKSSVLTLERGAAAWVAADDGPIRLVAERPSRLFRSR